MSVDDRAKEALREAHKVTCDTLCSRGGSFHTTRCVNRRDYINALARAACKAGVADALREQRIWLNTGHYEVIPAEAVPEPDWLPEEEKHGE